VVRQELLDGLLDQVLYRNAGEGARQLELPVCGVGNAGAELDLGLGVTGGPVGSGRKRASIYARFLCGCGHDLVAWLLGSLLRS
jgi:hypothetical protein